MNDTILMNREDLELLIQIVKENDIKFFKLIQQNKSGIGYITDIEFETELNGRSVTAKMEIAGTDNW